jgi:hypothetical protein
MSKGNGQTGLLALEAATAEITTASVTIKTLRVNSRQLTRGTFRQLQRRPLVDEDKVEVNGVVWGWVNYRPDGEANETQFVVQFGDKLCRCPFWVRDLKHAETAAWPEPLKTLWANHNRWAHCSAIDGVIRGDVRPAAVEDSGRRYLIQYKFGWSSAAPFPPFHPTIEFDSKPDSEFQLVGRILNPHARTRWIKKGAVHGARLAAENEDSAREKDHRRRIGEVKIIEMTEEEDVQEAKDRLAEIWEDDDECTGQAPEYWKKLIGRNADEALRYMVRWNDLMERLRSVEQLFIAT